MNERFILKRNSEKAKQDLTVPSSSSDIRLVAETNQTRPAKQRGFRKMARDSKVGSGARPSRRIKLNRSIFNAESTAQPSIHVKTLSEIKSEKESKNCAEESTEVSGHNNINCVVTVINNSISSPNVSTSPNVESASPIPARSVNISPSPTLTVNPSPLSVKASPCLDTRTVISSDYPKPVVVNTKKLLLPSIELIRITQNKRKQRFMSKGKSPSHSDLSPVPEKCKEMCSTMKRKLAPPMPPTSNESPVKKCKFSPVRSPDCQLPKPVVKNPHVVPLQPPSPLDNPPSPALSLGAQTDDLDNDTYPSETNSRVIVMSNSSNTNAASPKKHIKTNVHSRLGPPQNTGTIPSSQTPVPDDRLDVMSIIADDDLFLDDNNKAKRPLKRGLLQDSIFDVVEETNDHSHLNSLAKKTQTNRKHSAGDLFTSKSLSKSFKIPRQSSNRETNRNIDKHGTSKSRVHHQSQSYTSGYAQKEGDSSRNNFFHGSHLPPKPTRVVSKDGWAKNGFSVEERNRTILRHLRARYINEAWLIVKELGDSNVDIKMLEETVKVCAQVSLKDHTKHLVDIAKEAFEMLKHREPLKPMTYVYTILTLCRCSNFKEGFDKLSEMIEAQLLLPEVELVLFISDLVKSLQANPKWIIELLQVINKLNFSKEVHVFNNCLSCLVTTPVEKLREISPHEWTALISMLTNAENVQGAMQIQSIMDKHHIPMSDESVAKLLTLYENRKCIKQLLDLVHLKGANEAFDVVSIFSNDNVNLSDVEAHFTDVFKTGSLPCEDILHHFIDKASSSKEYRLVYDLFLKSKGVSLSMTTLKKMVDVLENWDENVSASIQVYSALRKAKTCNKRDSSSTPPLNPSHNRESNKPQSACCFEFRKSGRCFYGNNCRFSHDDVANNKPQLHRQRSDSSSPHSVGESRKSDVNDNKMNNSRTQSDVITTPNTTMVNGHCNKRFPSFQQPPFILPMFNANYPPVRIPKSVRHPGTTTTHSFPAQFQPKNINKTQRFACASQPLLTNSICQPSQVLSDSDGTPDRIKLNRSFSWEPVSKPKPLLRQSPLPRFQQPSPSCDNNNNNSEAQQRLDQAVTSKDWPELYLWYVEVKQPNHDTVQAVDLKMMQSAFLKDIADVGTNFAEFVEFIYKEKTSVKSSNSGSSNNSPFDQYDIEFLGSLGVSLMEKCQATKRFDKGYEILHTLHAKNINYFDCGKNFGAYTRDIPASAVAIIAVKLCMGMTQENGLLGAVEVLRSSNYAMPEENITPENMEYRIKVLRQLFTQLFDQGNISEACELIQHLKASPNVMVSLYVKVLNHYSSVDDFDQSFDVLTEMYEHGFDLNISASRALYTKFLKLCLTNEQNDEALVSIKEMESRGIMLNGDVWQEILNNEVFTSKVLADVLFEKCVNLGVYTETFSSETPWLCQLDCCYSQLEMKLLILRHFKQLYKHLLEITHNNITMDTMKDFQITLFPRLSGNSASRKFDGNIQTAMNKSGSIVTKVLEEDLNPPLIAKITQEQFHSKFVVNSMSIYRWFNANQKSDDIVDDDDDASSNASIGSCVSYMTVMTEFN